MFNHVSSTFQCSKKTFSNLRLYSMMSFIRYASFTQHFCSRLFYKTHCRICSSYLYIHAFYFLYSFWDYRLELDVHPFLCADYNQCTFGVHSIIEGRPAAQAVRGFLVQGSSPGTTWIISSPVLLYCTSIMSFKKFIHWRHYICTRISCFYSIWWF